MMGSVKNPLPVPLGQSYARLIAVLQLILELSPVSVKIFRHIRREALVARAVAGQHIAAAVMAGCAE